MRKFGATLIALLFSSVAHAQVVTKAPPAPVVPGYPYASSGFYFGVGASSAAGSSTVANASLLSAGAGVDGVIGYQWKGGLEFIAAEFDATYTNIGSSALCNASNPVSCQTSSQWELEPLVKFGFPLTTITALLPNLSSVFPALPALPAGVTPTNQHPYIYVGAPVRDTSASYGLASATVWTVQPEVGAGLLSQWQQGLALDVRGGCSLGNVGLNLTGSVPARATVNTICQARLEALY